MLNYRLTDTNAFALQGSVVSSATFHHRFAVQTFVKTAPNVLFSRQTSYVSVHLVMAVNSVK